jgi:Transglutaminase-like superfamily
MIHQQLSLARDAFICVDGEHVILLDLSTDKYMSLPRAQAAHLHGVVPGWPVSGPAGLDGTRDEAIRALVERQLLTADAHRGKTAAPLELSIPTSECVPQIEDARPVVGIVDVYRFAKFSIVAAVALRLLPLADVIRRIRRRTHAKARVGATTAEVSMREAVAKFVQLRLLFAPTKDTCLVDAIALRGFLAQYGFRSNLVFGVRASPFHAHCWLQVGDVVINDTIESIARFKPIMLV